MIEIVRLGLPPIGQLLIRCLNRHGALTIIAAGLNRFRVFALRGSNPPFTVKRISAGCLVNTVSTTRTVLIVERRSRLCAVFL